VNGRLDRVCCMLCGKSICWRDGFADLWCGLLCGCVVLERVRMSEGKQQGQFTNHPSLTPEYPAPPKSHRCKCTS
jgi:hypothetical protein